MGLKKHKEKLSSGKESLWVYHYDSMYPSGRKKIRAIHKGVKLFTGKGKYQNPQHEILFDIFYSELKKKILYQDEPIHNIINKEVEFFEFAARFIERKKAERTRSNYKTAIDFFRVFTKGSPVYFKNLTLDQAEAFKRWLFKQPKKTKPSETLHNNYIHKINSQMIAIVNAAIDEDQTSLQRNPFAKVDIKLQYTIHEYLEPDEIKLIEKLDISTTPMWNNLTEYHRTQSKLFEVRNWFLLCYDLGLRHGDLWQLANHIRLAKSRKLDMKKGFVDFDNRIIAQFQKKTGQLTSIQMSRFSWNIFKAYNFELPYVAAGVINRQIKKIAKHLGINKNLHIHITNHSRSTNLHEAGASLEDISLFQGKSIKVLKRHYLQKQKLRISQRFNDMFDTEEAEYITKPEKIT